MERQRLYGLGLYQQPEKISAKSLSILNIEMTQY